MASFLYEIISRLKFNSQIGIKLAYIAGSQAKELLT
jgi:hypothetical protein